MNQSSRLNGFDYAAFNRWLNGQYRKVDDRKADLDRIRAAVESARQPQGMQYVSARPA